ncbi:hypothetical protein [Streptococcus intermedius]|uniref:hypothetical protein n=2 Tax=Streptococcus anginosus group TaxID=671232 RepID=UPI000E3B8CC6|nr:hypothetical protein [Streptococcus intermedius]
MPVITNENVQIWTLYATVVISVIGFFFNTLSLWQTRKATEDMAKPYINVYVDAYAVKSQQRVYVFKNFGHTPAYIKNIVIDGELDELNSKHRFQSLIGNMIAPGQKLTSSIHPNYKGNIVLKITYTDSKKRNYTDQFTLNSRLAADMLYTVNETNTSNATATAIRQSTMALLRDLR